MPQRRACHAAPDAPAMAARHRRELLAARADDEVLGACKETGSGVRLDRAERVDAFIGSEGLAEMGLAPGLVAWESRR
jgi:hypothetical protein